MTATWADARDASRSRSRPRSSTRSRRRSRSCPSPGRRGRGSRPRRRGPRRRCGTSRPRSACSVCSGRFQYSRMKLPPRAHTSPFSPVVDGGAVLVADADVDAHHRPAGRAQQRAAAAVVVGREERQHRRALGHAVALPQVRGRREQLDTAARAATPASARRRRRGRAARPSRSGRKSGMVEDHGDHRRDHHRPVDGVALDRVHHLRRLEQRHEHRRAADRRDAEDPAHRGGVEHRRLVQVDPRGRSNSTAMPMWYRLSISARWSSSTPLATPVVPPVYISTTGSSPPARPGRRARRRRSGPRNRTSWGTSPSPISTTWRSGRSSRTSAMLRAKWSANTASTNTTVVPESARMYCSSLPARRRLSGLMTPRLRASRRGTARGTGGCCTTSPRSGHRARGRARCRIASARRSTRSPCCSNVA